MNNYTVEYSDDVGYQRSRQVEARKPIEAARNVVDDDELSRQEAEGIELRVYETGGDPEDSEFFNVELFL